MSSVSRALRVKLTPSGFVLGHRPPPLLSFGFANCWLWLFLHWKIQGTMEIIQFFITTRFIQLYLICQMLKVEGSSFFSPSCSHPLIYCNLFENFMYYSRCRHASVRAGLGNRDSLLLAIPNSQFIVLHGNKNSAAIQAIYLHEFLLPFLNCSGQLQVHHFIHKVLGFFSSLCLYLRSVSSAIVSSISECNNLLWFFTGKLVLLESLCHLWMSPPHYSFPFRNHV